MKADERVSDDRLDELKRLYEGDPTVVSSGILPYVKILPFHDDLLQLLREIQSRRAAEQAALPAVEEMAESIERLVSKIVSEYLPGDILLGDEHRQEITAALAPLYAKLAEYAEVLGECREQVNAWYELQEERMCKSAHEISREEFAVVKRKCDTTLKTLARIDALLGAKGET